MILDEVHHGGDALSWGDAIREAFEPAERRLSLTGTPFRSDTAPIPFVEYAPNEKGIRISRTDYNYGYGRALADGVVRPVIFMAYAGKMRWRTRMGDEMEARLGERDTKDVTAQAWRTALDPAGEWMPAVLRAANRRLTEVRHDIPDAGGLVIATDQTAARAYAVAARADHGREARRSCSPTRRRRSQRIEKFAQCDQRWMVAVRMVSEGVDVPRLAVGVYATVAATPLYFAQAVGRFVRARRRGETASIFVPSVPTLIALASALELERDHALDRERAEDELLDDDLDAEQPRGAGERSARSTSSSGRRSSPTRSSTTCSSTATSSASTAMPGTDEELDFIGMPGHPRARSGARAAAPAAGTPGAPDARAPAAGRGRHGAGAALPHAQGAAAAAELARGDAREGVGGAARAHPRRAAPHLRRSGGRAGDGAAAAGADRALAEAAVARS